MRDAALLVEALPYIRQFSGKKFVLKFGGAAMLTEEGVEAFAQDVAFLRFVGIQPVVVHGGGPEITRAMERMGKEAKKVEGLRVTDNETLEITEMVLVGKIASSLVARINHHGGRAVGLSGRADRILLARKTAPRTTRDGSGKEVVVDLGHVGEVERVNPDLINLMCVNGFIPVVSPIGVDEMGNALNINADTAASHIAAALVAEKLVIMTDVPGILKVPGEPSSLVSEIDPAGLRELVRTGVISGGMAPKAEACLRAMEAGVRSVHIIDGKVDHGLLVEVFTERGAGTMVSGAVTP